MAKVKIQGHASGTGVITLTAPNTSTDRTVTLPDEDITLGGGVDGIVSNADATAITINSSENVGIGDTTPTNAKLSIDNVLSGDAALAIKQDQAYYGIDINQDGNGMAFHIDTAATTQPAIEVEANALTTGKGMLISSNSADTSTRQLLRVTNDHASATGTTNLYVDNDSTGLVADFHGTGGIRSRYGIKFGTDTDTANALKDYEEGTFTATLTANSSAPSTAVTATGIYTKIGRVVTVNIIFDNKNTTGASGYAQVSGLPFTVGSKEAFGNYISYNAINYVNSTVGHAALLFVASGLGIHFYDMSDSGPWQRSHLTAGSGKYLYLSGTYTT